MKYIESDSLDPYYNLALEEYVFEKLPKTEEYFILWQNSRTIVVGKYQNTAEEINHKYMDEHGIRVARRLSGGGAVYHDEGNLNFTFVVDQDDSEDEFDFNTFSQPLIRVLASYGIRAEFTGRNDVLIDGCKICGNAQYAKNGRLMHHGCIMLDSDLSSVSDALKVKEAKFSSKSVKSVRSRVTTINACLDEKISMERFRADLAAEVMKTSAGSRYELSTADRRAIIALRNEKYATWEWNFGYDDAYEMKREAKFAAGLVEVGMEAENGVIRRISFKGDFFGNGDIAELEQALVGVRLDSGLTAVLKEKKSEYYISGVSCEELSNLMRG